MEREPLGERIRARFEISGIRAHNLNQARREWDVLPEFPVPPIYTPYSPYRRYCDRKFIFMPRKALFFRFFAPPPHRAESSSAMQIERLGKNRHRSDHEYKSKNEKCNYFGEPFMINVGTMASDDSYLEDLPRDQRSFQKKSFFSEGFFPPGKKGTPLKRGGERDGQGLEGEE